MNREAERKRLVELLQGAYDKYINLLEFEKNIIAKHLIENGVIVPPCKVGNVVYLVTPNGKIREINITDIYIEIKPIATVMRLSATFYVDNKPYFFQVSPFDFGKTVFLTREQAQAKLKEGGKG